MADGNKAAKAKTITSTRAKWPSDTPERRSVASLIPYARNARTHSDAQVAQIAASIREWGWTNPVLIDETGGIIAGHGRVMAARKLKIEEVPCIVATGWSEAQKRAYILADNQLAMNAGWDMDLLKVEIGDLKTEGFELGLIGFETAFLDDLMAPTGTEGLTDPDAIPEKPTNAASKPGDVWLLGDHKLLCGDSTREDPVKLLMGSDRADMVFTDPPYGVSYKGSGNAKSIAGDISQTAIPLSFKQAIEFATEPNARLYFCGGSNNVSMYYSLFDAYLRSAPTIIIWDKGQIVLRRNNYHSQYEVIFYGWRGKGGGPEFWFGGRKQDEASDIWQIKRDNGKDYVHPTQKPTALAERAMYNSSPAGGMVYEPFSGSGSTLIAAQRTGRICRAIELDPVYVDVAVLRWQAFTGMDATLLASGRTFDQTRTERANHVPA